MSVIAPQEPGPALLARSGGKAWRPRAESHLTVPLGRRRSSIIMAPEQTDNLRRGAATLPGTSPAIASHPPPRPSPTRGEGAKKPSPLVGEGAKKPSPLVGEGAKKPSTLVGEGWVGGRGKDESRRGA